jgi:hypothetical protein
MTARQAGYACERFDRTGRKVLSAQAVSAALVGAGEYHPVREGGGLSVSKHRYEMLMKDCAPNCPRLPLREFAGAFFPPPSVSAGISGFTLNPLPCHG